MCKSVIPEVKYTCGHRDRDAPETLIPWNGCGGCGVKKAGPEYLGATTKRVPCDDCIADGKYVKDAAGKWTRKAV